MFGCLTLGSISTTYSGSVFLPERRHFIYLFFFGGGGGEGVSTGSFPEKWLVIEPTNNSIVPIVFGLKFLLIISILWYIFKQKGEEN